MKKHYLKHSYVQKLKFLIVGSFAFVIDVCTYFVCEQVLDISPFWSRIVAFTVAVAVAWYGNRIFTFADRQSKKFIHEFLKAFMVSSLSLIPNMLIFLSLLYVFPKGLLFTFFAFSFGTAIGIITNYIFSHKFVFAEKNE